VEEQHKEMMMYRVIKNGDTHSTHESYRDAIDQADMIRGTVEGDLDAWKWAVSQQGCTRSYAGWQGQDDDERSEYEIGAAGIPTE
jgi:hypothetical protein